MKLKNVFYIIITGILLGVLLFQFKEVINCNERVISIEDNIKYKIDTLIGTKYITKPDTVYKYITKTDTVYEYIIKTDTVYRYITKTDTTCEGKIIVKTVTTKMTMPDLIGKEYDLIKAISEAIHKCKEINCKQITITMKNENK